MFLLVLLAVSANDSYAIDWCWRERVVKRVVKSHCVGLALSFVCTGLGVTNTSSLEVEAATPLKASLIRRPIKRHEDDISSGYAAHSAPLTQSPSIITRPFVVPHVRCYLMFWASKYQTPSAHNLNKA